MNNNNASRETLLSNNSARLIGHGLKLPCFVDQKAQIDSCLERFEHSAVNEGWNKDSYAIYLSALLTGKALDVYSRLPNFLGE